MEKVHVSGEPAPDMLSLAGEVAIPQVVEFPLGETKGNRSINYDKGHGYVLPDPLIPRPGRSET